MLCPFSSFSIQCLVSLVGIAAFCLTAINSSMVEWLTVFTISHLERNEIAEELAIKWTVDSSEIFIGSKPLIPIENALSAFRIEIDSEAMFSQKNHSSN